MAMTENSDTKFSLVIGGPFYRLQQRLGLLGQDLLPRGRAAVLLVALAWLPPAILAALQGVAVNPDLELGGYFLDYSVHARFVVAIASLVLMEKVAEGRIAMIIDQFLSAPLLTSDNREHFYALLRRADRWTSFNAVEVILLVIAFALSLNAAMVYLSTFGHSWFGSLVDGNRTMSWAGWWTLTVSLPLFWFLVLRWLWRLIIWSVLLRGISKLKLRLVATHPDQCGGIGFLAMFPMTFSFLVFAISCVTAAVVLQEVSHAALSLEKVGALFAVWFVLMLVTFIGPLLVFAPLLMRLKVQALLEYGKLAMVHNTAFEQRWIRAHGDSEELGGTLVGTHVGTLVGTPDISSLADLGVGYEAIKSMNSMPVSFPVLRQLFCAAGLPWLVIPLTQVPLLELLSMVSQALL